MVENLAVADERAELSVISPFDDLEKRAGGEVLGDLELILHVCYDVVFSGE